MCFVLVCVGLLVDIVCWLLVVIRCALFVVGCDVCEYGLSFPLFVRAAC